MEFCSWSCALLREWLLSVQTSAISQGCCCPVCRVHPPSCRAGPRDVTRRRLLLLTTVVFTSLTCSLTLSPSLFLSFFSFPSPPCFPPSPQARRELKRLKEEARRKHAVAVIWAYWLGLKVPTFQPTTAPRTPPSPITPPTLPQQPICPLASEGRGKRSETESDRERAPAHSQSASPCHSLGLKQHDEPRVRIPARPPSSLSLCQAASCIRIYNA